MCYIRHRNSEEISNEYRHMRLSHIPIVNQPTEKMRGFWFNLVKLVD